MSTQALAGLTTFYQQLAQQIAICQPRPLPAAV
jgi:hypothetical protein